MFNKKHSEAIKNIFLKYKILTIQNVSVVLNDQFILKASFEMLNDQIIFSDKNVLFILRQLITTNDIQNGKERSIISNGLLNEIAQKIKGEKLQEIKNNIKVATEEDLEIYIKTNIENYNTLHKDKFAINQYEENKLANDLKKELGLINQPTTSNNLSLPTKQKKRKPKQTIEDLESQELIKSTLNKKNRQLCYESNHKIECLIKMSLYFCVASIGIISSYYNKSQPYEYKSKTSNASVLFLFSLSSSICGITKFFDALIDFVTPQNKLCAETCHAIQSQDAILSERAP